MENQTTLSTIILPRFFTSRKLENLAVLNDGIQETIANFCETSNKFSYKN
jgi:hypothetical protein